VDDIFLESSDEELAALAQGGSDEASEYLIRKYKAEARGKCRVYFMPGADNDDIMQEGMIGLFKAIMSYDARRAASFRTFAELCINRQIMTAVKRAGRQKHSPLNTSVSINRPSCEGEGGASIADAIEDRDGMGPEECLLLKEGMDYIDANWGEIFSEMEHRVWRACRQGKSCAQMAREMGKSPKAIDNAVQRMKRKLERHFSANR
jgi:RNA polymerase sporulation-specific sigma factor